MELINAISGFIWGIPMLGLLFGTHIYMTIRTRAIQKRMFKGIAMSLRARTPGGGQISGFAALMTSLAATLGTGNIVGIAGAVLLGGPGAVFWCWIAGVFGIATKYAESLLAVRYRVRRPDGGYSGGAMYMLERGLHSRTLAVFFSVMCAAGGLGMGSMVQANSITVITGDMLGIPGYMCGAVVAFLAACVMLGGVRSIAGFCERLVPWMSGIYTLGCILIILINARFLGQAVNMIFSSAFSLQAGAGGIMGAGMTAAMRFGISRGLFSNEAGLGSSPIVTAAAGGNNAEEQALIAATATFWDTVVMCAITGITVVVSIAAVPSLSGCLDGGALIRGVFKQVPFLGSFIMIFGVFTFAFATIVGWSFYGERAVEYLWGGRFVQSYRIAWIICVYLGSLVPLHMVFGLADILNAGMALPNILALILLYKNSAVGKNGELRQGLRNRT